jgi:hypothetical protein
VDQAFRASLPRVLLDHFAEAPDSRALEKVRYPLDEVLFLMVAAHRRV